MDDDHDDGVAAPESESITASREKGNVHTPKRETSIPP
jgi:hypothetical protein